jgi:hypothetical protein
MLLAKLTGEKRLEMMPAFEHNSPANMYLITYCSKSGANYGAASR